MNKPTPITMKDIARELGVAVSTVSRALKDSQQISKEQREKIKTYAREHNFYPNILAESLRKSRLQPTRTIGVIVPQVNHFYFSSILSGIEQRATERGYMVAVAQSNENYDDEVRICDNFLRNRCCGIIVSQAKNTQKYDHFQKLLDNHLPVVFYDRICTGLNTNRVVVDDYMGAFNAVTHLINTGCKRIAFFGTAMNLEISKNRYNGYRDALLKNGITPDESLNVNCGGRDEAEEIIPRLLDTDNRPDAFFAINDDTAIGILHAVKKSGLRIPEDISICGFTNSTRTTACDPMLTTVEQRGPQVGREAVDVLLDQVEGITPQGKIEKRVVRTRLIVRGTTK